MSGPTTAGNGGTTTEAMLAAACLGVVTVVEVTAAVDNATEATGFVGTIGVKLVEMFMEAGARRIFDGSGGTSACHRGGEGLTDKSL